VVPLVERVVVGAAVDLVAGLVVVLTPVWAGAVGLLYAGVLLDCAWL
jgi:hypothetical protein